MSYQTYITEALVCGSFARNTSDKVFLLFTREAGMLYATARSVREERSKQRSALQEFSQIKVALIKGKQGWRVGSAVAGLNYFSLAENREARGSVVMIFKMLRRFIQGEEPSPKLFDFCVEAFVELTKDIQDRSFLELIIQFKIMIDLGYIDEKDIPTEFTNSHFSDIGLYKDKLSAVKLKALLDKAIDNSHL